MRPDLAILTMTGILDAKPKVGYIFAEKNTSSIAEDYLKKITVGEIMSKAITITEETNIYDAIINLFLNDTGTLFVCSNGSLCGAVSRKDFLKVAMGKTDINKVPVGIIMTRMPNIVYVEEKDSAYKAAKKIISHEVDSLPVVEKIIQDNKEIIKVVGKLSKTNITKVFVKLGEGLLNF